jgi:glycosyltransferase involved in cell wall biosynthesis
MKVSVITVCYNSKKTIEKAILSVLNQSYEKIEYIIVDGGSDDGTVELICSTINEFSRNVIWISEPDKGIYDAMNKGLRLATGDLIGILNSDDTFFSNSVVKDVVSFHKLYNIDVSIGNVVQINSENKIKRIYNSKSWTPTKLKYGFMPPHPSIFIRKRLYGNLGVYNIDFEIAADYELITRFFLVHKAEWKYSGITTTSMLLGGVSSSGMKSYQLISLEITKALEINGIKFSRIILHLRVFWKLYELIKRKIEV